MKIYTSASIQEQQSTELAIGSFIISTLLFILYITAKKSADILIIAAPFIASAILLNLIMLSHLTDLFVRKSQHRKDIAVKILILLSNIPIAFLYYLVIMKL
ncbi:hypothetical protein SGQ44_16140 [Flavobacterium sp. Fl-77]|uniref:Uncharacterized protein n=1 Tax=Flavobacterium flavipigmentatum TaxID=2893884 RepID=A0AAJ2SBK8_9FLAO|nr:MULTISPECIES: hypothetical protein [unclassified Flavobacterium]MDX6183743.1 hypothetical protein [Flavobacterium sp. Fl-33]MDX6187296.1 hypothetical protein [Flavobacterium sp. Fl-77]UFH38111.1 hypothetical protein LNP22_15385 [Flavobacterium sp. F-70]